MKTPATPSAQSPLCDVSTSRRAGRRWRFLAIPFIALTYCSCASTGSQATSDACVTLQKSRRLAPSFNKIDGVAVSNSHQIHMAPGRHEAELTLDWQGAPDEIVTFPLEIPESGDYVIQLVESPKLNLSHSMPTLTRNFVSEIAPGMDPHAGMAMMGPLALLATVDTTVGGAIQVIGPDQVKHPLHTAWLRLRRDSHDGLGRVLTWKQFDHPTRRKKQAAAP